MIARLRNEEGFGLLELLISLVMLNVGILALVAAFNGGSLAIQRASRTGTATVLADKQMELYRALLYANIALDTANVTTASANLQYSSDSAYNASQVSKVCAGSPSSVAAECKPMQTITGPDKFTYRVDTYIVYVTPTSGRQLKKVTVVTRDAAGTKAFARVSSYFDQSTG